MNSNEATTTVQTVEIQSGVFALEYAYQTAMRDLRKNHEIMQASTAAYNAATALLIEAWLRENYPQHGFTVKVAEAKSPYSMNFTARARRGMSREEQTDILKELNTYLTSLVKQEKSNVVFSFS